MKSQTRPDFFTALAPPGFSRESTLRLDREGVFWHNGGRVEHAAMARAFATWLSRHPENGRYILNNGVDWCYLEIEDVPFFVESVRDENGAPWVMLSDATSELLDVKSLRISADSNILYTDVKAGQFPARFRRSAQLELAPWLETKDNQLVIRVGTKTQPLSIEDESGCTGEP